MKIGEKREDQQKSKEKKQRREGNEKIMYEY